MQLSSSLIHLRPYFRTWRTSQRLLWKVYARKLYSLQPKIKRSYTQIIKRKTRRKQALLFPVTQKSVSVQNTERSQHLKCICKGEEVWWRRCSQEAQVKHKRWREDESLIWFNLTAVSPIRPLLTSVVGSSGDSRVCRDPGQKWTRGPSLQWMLGAHLVKSGSLNWSACGEGDPYPSRCCWCQKVMILTKCNKRMFKTLSDNIKFKNVVELKLYCNTSNVENETDVPGV